MTDRRAHFILQGKGGIGKSFVASLLAQFYLAKGAPVRCIDTDPLNGTLSGYKGLNAKRINIVENNRVHARLFDDMMEDVLSADVSSVVDVGGASFIHLVNYMVENRAFEAIAEAGITPTVHSVVVGGQPMVDTLEGFRAVADALPAVCELIVWENEAFGPVRTEKGTAFQAMSVYADRKDRVLGVIKLADRDSDTFRADLNDMLSRRLTFSEALESPGFRIMARSRLKIVWEDYQAQIALVL